MDYTLQLVSRKRIKSMEATKEYQLFWETTWQSITVSFPAITDVNSWTDLTGQICFWIKWSLNKINITDYKMVKEHITYIYSDLFTLMATYITVTEILFHLGFHLNNIYIWIYPEKTDALQWKAELCVFNMYSLFTPDVYRIYKISSSIISLQDDGDDGHGFLSIVAFNNLSSF